MKHFLSTSTLLLSVMNFQTSLNPRQEAYKFEHPVLPINPQIKKKIDQLIESGQLTCHYQPIIASESYSIYAFEALCRLAAPNPFGTIDELFTQAMMHKYSLELDMKCRENAICIASEQNIQRLNALLFINICPSSLLHPDHNTGSTEYFAQKCNFEKNNIVLEITEQEAVSNYKLFEKAIHHYRDRGFKIAIDDFGSGYGGLKMLSIIEPDYVKIDRHFFKDREKSHINYNLIDAISTACHRIGIDVIAEGIETEEDYLVCRELGINLMQGYYFAKPAAEIIETVKTSHLPQEGIYVSSTSCFDEVVCIGDIAAYIPPISVDDRVLEILNRFNSDPDLLCIPVTRGNHLCGIVNRQRFMEKHMVGRHGHGLNLNYYKKVGDILEPNFLHVPRYISIEDVSKKINLRQKMTKYDDICVTASGRYVGTVQVSEILNAITANNLMLAKNANPLTGLPGNEFIQREISRMVSQLIHFDVCYVDIDNFKPYNDCHGFAQGDRVIKLVGNILEKAIAIENPDRIAFAGHIGGDDFILITRPKQSISVCKEVIRQFHTLRAELHTEEELSSGTYESCDRNGNINRFSLLSLSIGIVSTELHKVCSFAEISSIATDLKKRAKSVNGSVIVRDRRKIEWQEP